MYPETLFLVTDPKNGSFAEDRKLAGLLGRYFRVRVVPFSDWRTIPTGAGAVLIRNIWPHHKAADVQLYRRESLEMRRSFARRRIPAYNGLTGRGDVAGKEYLVGLYRRGYPVIPSTDNSRHISRLPDSRVYVVKPKDGLSAVGLRFVDREEAGSQKNDGCIIQPRINFVEESCFFFVDDRFVYAVRTRDRRKRSGADHFVPSMREVATARRFVRWNTLRSGLQRVDFCRTKEGDLLLMEMEDDSPYLFLEALSQKKMKSFVRTLAASIRRHAKSLEKR